MLFKFNWNQKMLNPSIKNPHKPVDAVLTVLYHNNNNNNKNNSNFITYNVKNAQICTLDAYYRMRVKEKMNSRVNASQPIVY